MKMFKHAKDVVRKKSVLAVLTLVVFVCGILPVRAGLVEDCTEDAFINAVLEDGTATFDHDCTIVLTQPFTFENPGDIIIDAGENNVTISGKSNAIFMVQGGITLKLFSVNLVSGLSSNGSAIFITNGASVLASNCVFANNRAIGTN